MKVYRTDEIRNVVLLGHGGSGKTSLAEAMAYVSGATNRMGKITDGNTISDFDKEEQKREFSISTSLIPIEWEKAKINILDTPGYFDFVGEVEEAVSAADAAVIVVSGKAGVEVGTEKAWELCDKYKLPRMVYVTEMDVDDASFRQVVQDLTDRYGKVIAPHFQPIRENEKLVGYVNVIKNAARRYTGVGQREECEIPEYCKPNLEIYRDKLLEAVAETSEAFMERYFDGDEFSVEEIRSAMRTEVMDGDIVPVAMGSNVQAQGVANDDPRVYMPSSMHEQPWDAYALYSAWDDDNLYFLIELANTTYITSPEDNFAASNEARPWRNSIPMYLALSIDPAKQATGKAVGTNKDGSVYTNPFVWGCTNGTAKDGGTGFTTHIDTLVAFDSNNSNGGASIFKADTQDTDGTYMFNYDTRIPIGVTSFQAQDNKNGFKIKYANGTKSTSLFGINAPKGSRVMGDNLDMNSNWVDFFDEGYKNSYGYVYEIAVPLNTLGIDRSYIETQGIGAMQILTYGTSGMDTLPHDPSMLDQANLEYSYDPSTSHEKEDIDNITVPLARIGALLPDTEVNEAPFEVNFGANLNSGQSAGTPITLLAESYHATGDVTYSFTVNGETVQNSNTDSCVWTPSADGTYSIGVVAVDANGNKAESTKTFVVGSSSSDETLKGDVNRDGSVTVVDATLVQKYIVKLEDFDAETMKIADVNGNGIIEVTDATLIQKIITKLA